MYVLNSTFTIALLKTDAYPFNDSWALSAGAVFSSNFQPRVIRFDTEEEAQSFLIYCDVEQKTTLYVSPIWHHNFGHGIFDGFYPAYLGLIELGLHNRIFDILAYIDDCDATTKNHPCQETESIMQRFCGGQFKSFNELLRNINIKKSKGIVFSSFVVGAKNKAARVLQRDGGIAGGRSLNAMHLFTRRVMRSYGITFKKNHHVFKAIIIHNKRFTDQNVEMFKELALYYSPNMTIDYIDWRTVVPFSSQLKVLAQTDLYITGPGTGMMLHPFMSEGSVVINLGECRNHVNEKYPTPKVKHPLFMEQYIAEGTPYQRALYFSSKSICNRGYNKHELMQLIETSRTGRGFKIPVPQFSNLSPEGRVFVETCSRNKTLCDLVMPEFNNENTWMETFVYEMGAWDKDTLKKFAINRTLLGQVKLAYNELLFTE